MGQAMLKLTRKGADHKQLNKDQEELLKETIGKYITSHPEIEKSIQEFDGFYHVVYDIVQDLSDRNGAMLFKLPDQKILLDKFSRARGSKKDTPLTKEELKQIMESIVSFDSFTFGEGARDIFLYIFGVPVLALFAKRLIPGPTKLIPDHVIIPMATSGTVYLLAKSDKL